MAEIIPGMIYPTSSSGTFYRNASNTPLLADIEAKFRAFELEEQYKQEQRMAALRATAPPLTFADHLYKDEQQ